MAEKVVEKMIKKVINNKILLIFLSIIFSILIEFLISNGINIYENGFDTKNYKIEDNNIKYYTKEVEKTEIVSEQNKKSNIFEINKDNKIIKVKKKNTSIEIKCSKKYINKIKIKYKTDEDTSKTIEYYTFDAYGNKGTLNDYISFEKEFNYVIKPIKNEVEKIKIDLGDNDSNLIIESVTIINAIGFNIYRFIVILCINLSLVTTYFFRKRLSTNIEIFFLIICLGTGISMITATPSLLRYSWDDHVHFENIYSMFETSKVCKSDSYNYVMKVRAIQVNVPETFEENIMIDKYLNSHNDCNSDNMQKISSNTISYQDFSYIPSALIVKICKILNVPFSITFRLGKLINLVIYSLIGYYTIKNAKYGKKILFIILLLPTNIFLASQYSKDSYITALLTLGISTFINCYMENGKISTKKILLILLSILIGCLSKAIYIPFILLILMFPNKKFPNKTSARLIKILILLLLSIMMYSFIFPSVSDASVVADIRGGEATNSYGQISLIISQPLSFLKVFVPYFFKIFIDFFVSTSSLIVYCNLGIMSGNIYYLLLFTIIFVLITGETQKKKIPNKIKIFILLLIAIVISFIIGSMYLSFNNVASTSINGVQQRYFLPLFYPVALLFSTNKIITKIEEKKYNTILCLIMMFILYYSIYMMMIKT